MSEIQTTQAYAFISQPMSGLSDEEIRDVQASATMKLTAMGYKVMNSYLPDAEVLGCRNLPLGYLARSLSILANCDAIYMCKGFMNARGCLIEERCAAEYGIKIIYESEENIDD